MSRSERPAPTTAAVVALFGGLLVGACGARTALPAPEATEDEDEVTDGGRDAAADVREEASTVVPVACVDGRFDLTRAVPDVMLVLDRSGSMSQSFSGGTGGTGAAIKWTALTNALAETLPPIDQSVAVGALLYPTGSLANFGCQVPARPDFDPGFGNVTRLIARMRGTRPNGSTPTHAAVDAAAVALRARRAATSARAMVLATDGAPGCNLALDPRTCRCISNRCSTRAERCLDDVRTVETIARHARGGIPTYVIGIAGTADAQFAEVLERMAVAGGRPSTTGGRSFYAANSPEELEGAVVTIRQQVGVCTYLTSSVPSAAGTISVTLDGAEVPHDPGAVDGWTWGNQSNGEIVFVGRACTAAASAVAFEVRVDCNAADASTPEGLRPRAAPRSVRRPPAVAPFPPP